MQLAILVRVAALGVVWAMGGEGAPQQGGAPTASLGAATCPTVPIVQNFQAEEVSCDMLSIYCIRYNLCIYLLY